MHFVVRPKKKDRSVLLLLHVLYNRWPSPKILNLSLRDNGIRHAVQVLSLGVAVVSKDVSNANIRSPDNSHAVVKVMKIFKYASLLVYNGI